MPEPVTEAQSGLRHKWPKAARRTPVRPSADGNVSLQALEPEQLLEAWEAAHR